MGGQPYQTEFMWAHACHAAWGKQKASLKPNPICRAEGGVRNRDKRKYHGEQERQVKKVSRLLFFSFFSLFLFLILTAACKGRQKGCRMDHGINILCLLEKNPGQWLTATPRMPGMSALLQTLERDHHHNSALLLVLPKTHCTA